MDVMTNRPVYQCLFFQYWVDNQRKCEDYEYLVFLCIMEK